MKKLRAIMLFLLTVLSCVTQNGISPRDVAVPSIDTVSQGVFINFIRIDWHTDTTGLARFEIYRSAAENSAYLLIAVVDASPAENSYNDTAATTAVYYYKIAAIDNNGRKSKLSAAKSGFIRPIPKPPVLSIEEHADHITLLWAPVAGAVSYAVYRSSAGCLTGMVRIDQTVSAGYCDSATVAGAYYYTVAVLDSAGHDVATSNCVRGSLSTLTAPSGAHASDEWRIHMISLQWDSVPGARGYIIFRSSGSCPNTDEEIVRTQSPSYIDSVTTSGYYYYAVAAIDKIDRMGAMSLCFRGSMGLLSAPESLTASFETHPGAIALSWKATAGAGRYVIYRSKTSCSSNMVKINDDTKSTTFYDSVPTSEIYGYVVAGVDSSGVEGLPSICREGRVKLLPAPANVRVSSGQYLDGILVSWDAVEGATGYVYYKGTSNIANAAVPMDTVTSLFDFDTVKDASLKYYWVTAWAPLGPQTRSKYVYGRILTAPVLSLVNDTEVIRLSWTMDTASAKLKYIYRSENGLQFVCIDSATGFSYNDTPSDYNAYHYRICVKTAVGDTILSNTVSGSESIPIPTGFTAVGTANGVQLRWNRVPGIISYCIYRSDSLPATMFYDIVADTSFFDTLTTSTRYYYCIAAISGHVTSAKTEPIVSGIIPSLGKAADRRVKATVEP